MSLIKHLLEKPRSLNQDAKYTVLNGVAYMAVGTLLIAWPGVTQTVFRDAAFAGQEEALMRVIGLTVAVIGWLYIFGGRSGARQFVAASVLDRVVPKAAWGKAPRRRWRAIKPLQTAMRPVPTTTDLVHIRG